MDYKTRNQIIRNYKLPQDIQDFIDKTPLIRNKGYTGWYSEDGILKIK